ncbi:MAG: 2-isopropylmalate synthase [Deltaproteobacteria bacterium]|nr:2-isopropylmalate synthase [Deltaproteobacteria bacterium]
MTMPVHKYRPFPPIDLPDRHWPQRTIDRAPAWCSVDLRDGNQALVEPMGVERKLQLFEELVRIGFKQIEIAFPSASETEFEFVRALVDEHRIPGDVTVQVLTQAREHLIHRTFEALQGMPKAIVHLYNSTSTLQRQVVFGQDRAGIVGIAVKGAQLCAELAAGVETDVRFEYSPESFTGTELDFAVEICEAVMDVWQPTRERPVILNLPSTVEMATPNVYADQIEWFGRHVRDRDAVVLSVHPHNDRGTAVAAAELALMAGADRVEGTLFGNGERTGNVDVVTLAMNLFSQGIDPGLDMSDMNHIVRVSERCTRMPVPARHPWAGELVFTAFSGSHQDAIQKGFATLPERSNGSWEVPYLPIDPADVGRRYEEVVRINSQSGKGGIAHVLERDHGLRLPRGLQVEFREIVQRMAEQTGEEIGSDQIWRAFSEEYVGATKPYELLRHRSQADSIAECEQVLTAVIREDGRERTVRGEGSGPIDAFANGLRREFGLDVRVLDYREHAVSRGTDARAVCYVEVAAAGGSSVYGVGLHASIVTASLEAILSAVNRASRTD